MSNKSKIVYTKKDAKELSEMFNLEVVDDQDHIDPNNEYHWESLAIGWLIGKGVAIEDVEELSHFIY